MKTKKKKINTYLKYACVMAGCILAGAAFGVAVSFGDITAAGDGVIDAVHSIRSAMLPILALLLLAEVFCGELTISKTKALGRQLMNAEDEEGDRLELDLEKVNARGIMGSTVLNVLSWLVVSAGYSMEYIDGLEKGKGIWLMLAFGVFILLNVYTGFYQIRFIREIQKIYPGRNGDPVSMKFQEQWLKSCDEAEREMIYQASYRSYITTQKAVQFLLLIAMLGELIWGTGIMAILMIGVIWLIMTTTYCRACVRSRASKLNT